MTQLEVLKFLVESGPNRTQVELAKAIHGRAGYQQQVNQDCEILVSRGLVARGGSGGPGDPYRYHSL